MAIKVFVVDDAKCLHELADALLNEDVSPKSHVSETSEYGAASITEYGHVMLTNESAFVGNAWADPSTYSGKAVSGADGAAFDVRIKANAQAIANLQDAYKIPVGAVMISAAHATASAFATAIGYGTWSKIGDATVGESGSIVQIFYYQRTD